MRIAPLAAPLVAVFALVACTPEPDPGVVFPTVEIDPPPPEEPYFVFTEDPDREIPQMGTLRGTLEGASVGWDTFDFSVGAFDGDVQITSYPVQTLNISGRRPGEPRNRTGAIGISAELPALAPGPTGPATVTLYGEHFADPLLQAPAEVVIESITRGAAGSPMGTAYGEITARITAPGLCPSTLAPPCDGGLALTLTSEVQYDIP